MLSLSIDLNLSGDHLYTKDPWLVAVPYSGISNILLYLLLWPGTCDRKVNLLYKYDGTRPLRHLLYAMMASLNRSIWLTGSQWSCCRCGLMISYFLVPVTMHAAMFCTVTWSLVMFFLDYFAKQMNSKKSLLKTIAFFISNRITSVITQSALFRYDLRYHWD